MFCHDFVMSIGSRVQGIMHTFLEPVISEELLHDQQGQFLGIL